LLLVLLFASAASIAIDPERAFEDDALQTRYERLGRELRCLVCRSETIADSNAPLAVDAALANSKTSSNAMRFIVTIPSLRGFAARSRAPKSRA
jgi:hypothetical protein